MNRGLDTVSVGWIQNVAQQLYSRGTYTELGKNSNPAFDPPLIPGKDIWCVSNSPNPGTFPPGSVPNLISQFPLVDASVAGTIGAGWSPTMIDFYGISSHGFPPGGGETWTAAGAGSTGCPVPVDVAVQLGASGDNTAAPDADALASAGRLELHVVCRRLDQPGAKDLRRMRPAPMGLHG